MAGRFSIRCVRERMCFARIDAAIPVRTCSRATPANQSRMMPASLICRRAAIPSSSLTGSVRFSMTCTSKPSFLAWRSGLLDAMRFGQSDHIDPCDARGLQPVGECPARGHGGGDFLTGGNAVGVVPVEHLEAGISGGILALLEMMFDVQCGDGGMQFGIGGSGLAVHRPGIHEIRMFGASGFPARYASPAWSRYMSYSLRRAFA